MRRAATTCEKTVLDQRPVGVRGVLVHGSGLQSLACDGQPFFGEEIGIVVQRSVFRSQFRMRRVLMYASLTNPSLGGPGRRTCLWASKAPSSLTICSRNWEGNLAACIP
jgi:hypothetical protein